MLEAANEVYEQWKAYSDPEVDVLAFSDVDGDKVPHNTVTPIVRRSKDGGYEMDIVLRNNRCDEQHPEGIFHPHREMHHIKKENIGLIEVMGLAILPGRLKTELSEIAGILSGKSEVFEAAISGGNPGLGVHAPWIKELIAEFGTNLSKEQADSLLQEKVGTKFAEILEHAGVFKVNEAGREAFRRFVQSAGYQELSS
ncbi:Galactose-1-phosphate uridylyltransferase [compost metagenome]